MDYTKILNRNVARILEVLRTERSYFNEICEKTGIKSKNNLLRNLDAMVELGVLKKEKGKGNTFYGINYNNAVSLGFLGLINAIKLQELPLERRSAILEVVDSVKPEVAVVFGSTAKGNFGKSSDIDLLLVLEKTKGIGEAARKIGSRYGVRVNVNVVSVSEFESKNEGISHIIKTGFPVSGRKEFYEVYKNV
ncbi:MAG: nucleotidyltransferase domain-containing protein [archaeon]